MRVVLIRWSLRLLAALPLRAAQALGAGFGHLLWWLPNEMKKVVRVNVDLCWPHLLVSERAELCRQCLLETGRTAAEMGALWLWPVEKVVARVRQVQGEEHLRAGLARGKGVILAAPHLGNWEMIGLWVATHGPITTLYRPPRLEALDTLVRGARERGGATLLPTDASGVRGLMRALKKGELIGILPDQDPEGDSGVYAPFYGVEANTMVLLPKLARKTGATVLFVCAVRLPRGEGFAMHLLPAPTGIADADPRTAARALNEGVENCIALAPAQYQWGYKRFKRRPEPGPGFYRFD